MKPFPLEDPDQKELRGLERALESSANGTQRLPIDKERELQDEIVKLRNKIFERKTNP